MDQELVGLKYLLEEEKILTRLLENTERTLDKLKAEEFAMIQAIKNVHSTQNYSKSQYHQNKQIDLSFIPPNDTIGTNEQPLQLEVDNVLESLAKGGQDQMFCITGEYPEVEEEEDEESDNSAVYEQGAQEDQDEGVINEENKKKYNGKDGREKKS